MDRSQPSSTATSAAQYHPLHQALEERSSNTLEVPPSVSTMNRCKPEGVTFSMDHVSSGGPSSTSSCCQNTHVYNKKASSHAVSPHCEMTSNPSSGSGSHRLFHLPHYHRHHHAQHAVSTSSAGAGSSSTASTAASANDTRAGPSFSGYSATGSAVSSGSNARASSSSSCGLLSATSLGPPRSSSMAPAQAGEASGSSGKLRVGAAPLSSNSPMLLQGAAAPPDPRILTNEYIWRKIEALIERMQSANTGVPVRNHKKFMKKTPSVFTAHDLMQWLERWLKIDDRTEAFHVASMIAAIGYFFPIDDHVLAVKNEHQLMRYQTPCLYPSRATEAEEAEYAVYLCKRTMQNKQRLELADYEAERLARLQSLFCHKWEFIYMQAEAEARVDRKREKNECHVLESQERAFWDVHRPAPGCVNTTDIDMRKLCCAKRPKKAPVRPLSFPLPSCSNVNALINSLEQYRLPERVAKLQALMEKTRSKLTKSIENIQNYVEQYSEFDLLLNASTMQVVTSGSGSIAGLMGGGPSSLLMGSPSTSSTPAHHHSGGCTVPSNTGVPATATGATGGGLSNHTPAAPGGQSATSPQIPGMTNVNGVDAVAAAVAAAAAASTAMSSGPSNPVLDNSSNPWVSDNQAFWDGERRLRDVPIRRVKRWGFGIHELLRDVAGREEFLRWLEKEFSAENLRFYQLCQDLKGAPLREVSKRIEYIYSQFLAPNAVEALNVDSRVAESVRRRVASSTFTHPNRFCFEEAEEHIFCLMKNDSYCRFLRSEVYKDLLAGQKKKSKKKFPSDIRQKGDFD